MLENPDLVCFDLPCLVIPRPRTTDEALDRALRRIGVEDEALRQRATAMGITWPGTAARHVFGQLFDDAVWIRTAAAAFDDAFGAAVGRHGAGVADGASAAVSQLRSRGAHVCVTTEFSAATREAVLDVLQWASLVAMLVSEDAESDEVSESAVAVAVRRARVDPKSVVVVSGSPSGIAAGRDAGAGCVVGVFGPAMTTRDLRAAGATCISTLPQLAARWASPLLVPA